MVVDDEPSIRDMLRLVLESEDYQIITAANGKEALDLIEEEDINPDLILLDLMMPVMNGWEFVQELKKDTSTRSIPIVTISAYEPQGLQVEGYLPKPTSVDSILTEVKKYSH